MQFVLDRIQPCQSVQFLDYILNVHFLVIRNFFLGWFGLWLQIKRIRLISLFRCVHVLEIIIIIIFFIAIVTLCNTFLNKSASVSLAFFFVCQHLIGFLQCSIGGLKELFHTNDIAFIGCLCHLLVEPVFFYIICFVSCLDSVVCRKHLPNRLVILRVIGAELYDGQGFLCLVYSIVLIQHVNQHKQIGSSLII